MFNVVGVIARVDRKSALEVARRITTHLEKRNLSVHLEPKLAKSINRPSKALPLKEMKVDLLIIVGGDGTILRTCLQIPNPEPPILTINMGVRGFLAEVSPDESLEAVDRCLKGDFTLESCTKLASFLGDTRLPDALNEVLITSRTPAKLLHIQIWKDNFPVSECRSDGVVIASQTGSTGYALSAGGPVLDPDLDAFVLTPICPLTVFHPIVFPTKSVISIELLRPKRAVVVIDGHYQTKITPKEPRITVTRSEHKTNFIRFKEDFYSRLKSRLLFSGGESP